MARNFASDSAYLARERGRAAQQEKYPRKYLDKYQTRYFSNKYPEYPDKYQGYFPRGIFLQARSREMTVQRSTISARKRLKNRAAGESGKRSASADGISHGE